MKTTIEPKLAPPGAGLPSYEWFIAKFILVPMRQRTVSFAQGLEEFASESAQIDSIVKPLSEYQLTQRVLIPRLRGLEDSSRFWSVSMTMQHLVIVNTLMRDTITKLSAGRQTTRKGTIADVKPSVDVDARTIRQQFSSVNSKFLEAVSTLDPDANPTNTHAHPWFGELNARQWALFAAPHQRIHRTQIEQILKRL